MAVDREEAGGRMIEIVDRVLKLLEHVLLALAVAGDVGDRPHRRSGLVRLAERAHPQPQPARGLPARAGHPHFLLQAPPLLGRLAQAIDRLRDVGVADEDPLDRAHLLKPDGIGKHPVGGIGEQRPPGAVGDDDAVMGIVEDALEHRVAGLPGRDPQHTGGEGEHRKHPDHSQQSKKDHHVGSGLVAADHHETRGGDDQEDRNQQDQRDAAAAFAPRDHRRAQARRCHDEPYPPLLGIPLDSSLPQHAALRKGMPRWNVGGAAVFPEERRGARPSAASAVVRAKHPRRDAALRMAQIPCMMIDGDEIPWRHHFAIKPGFGRICRFSRDFMARIDNPR